MTPTTGGMLVLLLIDAALWALIILGISWAARHVSDALMALAVVAVMSILMLGWIRQGSRTSPGNHD